MRAVGAEARLQELGIELPGLLPAVGNYLPAKRHRDLVFVSGHGPLKLDAIGTSGGRVDGFLAMEDALPALIQGKVGDQVSLDEAREAARATGLFLLASLRAEIGSLDRVASILKVFGMVNCAPGFNQMAAVIDGCSDLLVDVFGESVGRHARSAVGMAELPLDIPLEIEMVAAVQAD
jgi:enamine deaminase RidA (YjgF/YER057c/UK114 family)